MKPTNPGPAILLAALALLVPSHVRAGVITYSTDFVLSSSYSLGMTGAFSIQLDDFKLIELPRYAGPDPLTGVAINLSSESYRLISISSTDDWPNEELVSVLPPVWLFYGNDASVEGTIDGELSISLLNPANVSRTVHFPKLSAECWEKTMDEDQAEHVLCVAENAVTDPYNPNIPVAGVPLGDFVGADPIRFLAVMNGLFSGLCGGPDPGNFGVDYDDCSANLTWWLWKGSISVTYTYGTADTTGGATTGGGVTTGGDSTSDVPEPLGLMAVGLAITGLRRAISRTGRFRASRYLAVAALVLGLPASTAYAAPITLDYHVTATSFGPMAPVDPVTFTFHLTVDDAVTVTDQTDGLTVTDSNIALPSTIAFSYFAVGDGGLRIFGRQSGVNLLSGTDDFAADFFFFSSTLLLEEFFYIQADTPRGVLFHTDVGVVSPVTMGGGETTGGEATGEVPEPVGLMAIGVAITGLRRSLRRVGAARTERGPRAVSGKPA